MDCNESYTHQTMSLNITAELQYPTPYAAALNYTMFSALMLSVARQKNCPDTATEAKKEYDFVIVGAGSAGSVVAARLSELPCVSVLLLEAGDKPPYVSAIPATVRTLFQTNVDYGYKTVPQKHMGSGIDKREVVWAAGKMVGGSSVLNDVQYSRGNRKNYDSWARHGARGWGYYDVLPYFLKLEDFTDDRYADDGYHAKGGPMSIEKPSYNPRYKAAVLQAAREIGYPVLDPQGPRQTGFYDVDGTLRDGQSCTTALGYLVPTENRTNIDILPNAMATKILFKKNRHGRPKAIGVKYEFEGKMHTVRARKEVIVSAGTVNTPKLLMLSGIGPMKQLKKFKIPVIADIPGVGENLQDHVGTNVNFEMSKDIPQILTKLTNTTLVQEYIDHRSGVLASAQLVTVDAFLESDKIHSETDSPDAAIYFLEAPPAIALQDFNLKKNVFDQLYGPYENVSFFTCFTHLLHPKSRGTVKLRSAHPRDPPLIDPNYFSVPSDIKQLVGGLKACKRIGTHPAMQSVGSKMFESVVPGCEEKSGNDDAYFTCQARAIGASFYHSVGTSKMGTDKMAVVSPELRVRGVDRLRVVDASIMPTIVTGDMNIPTIMVAEKASDMIKSTLTHLKCESRPSS